MKSEPWSDSGAAPCSEVWIEFVKPKVRPHDGFRSYNIGGFWDFDGFGPEMMRERCIHKFILQPQNAESCHGKNT